MVKKGVIIKLKKRHVIVFNNFMEYEQLKRVNGMIEGQLIEYQASENTGIYNKLKRLSGAAAVLIFLAIGFFIWFAESSKPHIFAYVGLDTISSVEFSIDESSKVINLRALNDDGEDILESLNLEGKPIDRAIMEVVLKSQKEVRDDEGTILISTSLDVKDTTANALNESNLRLSKTINRIQENLMKEKDNLSVKVISLDPEQRKNCLDNNISMGRYALYEKAKRSGVKVTLQEARYAPVDKLVKYMEKETAEKPVNVQTAGNTGGKELKNNTTPAVTYEEKATKQDNNITESGIVIPTYKSHEQIATPEPAITRQESTQFQPTPCISIISSTPVASSITDPVAPIHTPASSAVINTPAGSDAVKNAPTNTPAHTDNDNYRPRRGFTPGPDQRWDHNGQTPHPMPTFKHEMPPLVTPDPSKPLPGRTPMIPPDKRQIPPHNDKRPDPPDRMPSARPTM